MLKLNLVLNKWETKVYFFWKISGLAVLLRVLTAIAAIQPGSVVFFQIFCSIFFLILAPTHSLGSLLL